MSRKGMVSQSPILAFKHTENVLTIVLRNDFDLQTMHCLYTTNCSLRYMKNSFNEIPNPSLS